MLVCECVVIVCDRCVIGVCWLLYLSLSLSADSYCSSSLSSSAYVSYSVMCSLSCGVSSWLFC